MQKLYIKSLGQTLHLYIFDIKSTGNTYSTLKKYINKINIEFDHHPRKTEIYE